MSVRRLPREHRDIVARPLSGIMLAHATTVGRAEWWRKHPYSENIRGCEDQELWLRSYGDSRFSNLPEPLYFYREEQAYSLRAYLHDKAELARLLRRQRATYGLMADVAAAKQWLRIAAYAVAGCVGADRLLVQRRGSAPAAAEVKLFQEGLARIQTVRL